MTGKVGAGVTGAITGLTEGLSLGRSERTTLGLSEGNAVVGWGVTGATGAAVTTLG